MVLFNFKSSHSKTNMIEFTAVQKLNIRFFDRVNRKTSFKCNANCNN